MNTRSDRYSPRQSRHLDYISQFTSTIRHIIKGSQNVVADALSRIETNALVTKQPPVVNFEAIAEAQSTDKQLRALQSSSSSTLVIEAIPLTNSNLSLIVIPQLDNNDQLYPRNGDERYLIPYMVFHIQE